MNEPTNLLPHCRFRTRHNLWDTSNFVIGFFGMAPIAGIVSIFMSTRLLARPQAGLSEWFGLVCGICCTLLGFCQLVLLVWRHQAEAYELTDNELLVNLGFSKVRIPLVEIYGTNPCQILQLTFKPKPGVRVKYSNPHTRWGSIEIAPANLEHFLEELSARCPHLRREGPRLLPVAGERTGDQTASAAVADR
jgi:hypothetical protein